MAEPRTVGKGKRLPSGPAVVSDSENINPGAFSSADHSHQLWTPWTDITTGHSMAEVRYSLCPPFIKWLIDDDTASGANPVLTGNPYPPIWDTVLWANHFLVFYPNGNVDFFRLDLATAAGGTSTVNTISDTCYRYDS